jgi:preprotein translocase subunit SecE
VFFISIHDPAPNLDRCISSHPMFSKAAQFSREVKSELQKATWPWDPKERGMKKYRELVDSTLIVLIGMLLMSGYVSFWDFIMVNVVGALTK